MPAVFIFLAIVYFISNSGSFFESLMGLIGGFLIIIACIIGTICPPIGGLMAIIAYLLGVVFGIWY